LLERGTAPYFYLPKIESHEEARLWNDVFNFAEDSTGIPRGTIRATVLIETITAAFEMEEILYELRDHSVGLNCGRWDYIFSYLKKLGGRPEFLLPQRGDITMDQHFLNSYVRLLIDTCHRRGAHAMGGMAAQIPILNDVDANEVAMERVRKDKLREVNAGHDGTWVAHPGLVKIAMEIFERYMPQSNQIGRMPTPSPPVTQADLLQVPTGKITQEGVIRNVDVSLQYLESWLRGVGCVPIYSLMEDTATAEISRAQLWQWRLFNARTEDGAVIDIEAIRHVVEEILQAKSQSLGEANFNASRYPQAAKLLLKLVDGEFSQFLTTELYNYLD
jgi:malate synthase